MSLTYADRLAQLSAELNGLKTLLARRRSQGCQAGILLSLEKQIHDAEENLRATEQAYGMSAPVAAAPPPAAPVPPTVVYVDRDSGIREELERLLLSGDKFFSRSTIQELLE